MLNSAPIALPSTALVFTQAERRYLVLGLTLTSWLQLASPPASDASFTQRPPVRPEGSTVKLPVPAYVMGRQSRGTSPESSSNELLAIRLFGCSVVARSATVPRSRTVARVAALLFVDCA